MSGGTTVHFSRHIFGAKVSGVQLSLFSGQKVGPPDSWAPELKFLGGTTVPFFKAESWAPGLLGPGAKFSGGTTVHLSRHIFGLPDSWAQEPNLSGVQVYFFQGKIFDPWTVGPKIPNILFSWQKVRPPGQLSFGAKVSRVQLSIFSGQKV